VAFRLRIFLEILASNQGQFLPFCIIFWLQLETHRLERAVVSQTDQPGLSR
jgi:hypothetical protein